MRPPTHAGEIGKLAKLPKSQLSALPPSLADLAPSESRSKNLFLKVTPEDHAVVKNLAARLSCQMAVVGHRIFTIGLEKVVAEIESAQKV